MSVNTVNSTGDEVILTFSGVNQKDLIILSSTSSSDCVLRENTSGGDVIAYIPSGYSQFDSPIRVSEGTNVYLHGSSNVTVSFLWIHNI